jgi:hypothetical protein
MEGREVVATLTPPTPEEAAAAAEHGGGDLFPEGDDDTDAGQEGSGVIDGTNKDGMWPFPDPDKPRDATGAFVAAHRDADE